MSMQWIGPILLLFFQAAAFAAAPTLAPAPCKVGDLPEPQLCTTLAVPEDRTRPGGRTISLNVVVMPATADRTLPPLYNLEGGPGIAATDGAAFWASAGSIYREHRDIVLVDQRGTGRSAPLNCTVNFYDPLSPVLDAGVVSRCREQLSRHADLSAYSTAAAVEDLDAVRAALGHERIDLIGLSYGTRMAQEYLRAHPDRVRALALLGTLTPREKLPLSFSLGANAVLRRLASECTGDPACRKAIPDAAADLVSLQRIFAKGPVNVLLARRVVSVKPGPFWETVRGQLTTTTTQRRLPWLLHEAAQGRFEPLLAATKREPDAGANGMLLSVSCPEDTLRIGSDELAPLAASVFGSYRVRQQQMSCKAWGVKAPPTPRPGFVDSDVPALLMAGGMDAVTPVEWARDVAAHLPRSRVVVVPDLGHFPEGLSNMECYDRIIVAFFAAGTERGLDVACLESMRPPPFQTGSVTAEGDGH